ncbi:MAG: aspartate/glutamate racemase family protein [Spirochaetaceae bacterium]|nr:MAG: aspartate/glutamate racemase family protein [Spirochaetaceae bacterium]
MKYTMKPTQLSYGEAIGILLIENYVPFIPGDVANATSYSFPVRFEPLPGLTPERLFAHDRSLLGEVVAAAKRLARAGVRAITGDCGFLAIYQEAIAAEVGVPVFLSSLLQLDFIARIVGEKGRIGIVTANRTALTPDLLEAVTSVPADRLLLAGLEDREHFVSAVFREEGVLDSAIVEREVLESVETIRGEGDLRAILLECSLLPPYAAAVQERTGLPVFDYNTMINYVHQAVVAPRFRGHM